MVLIAVALLVLWKFYYKPRKDKLNAATPENMEKQAGSPARNQNRMSTETLTSLAPSSFARSSNIIPIAYIPGVTTRAVQNNNYNQGQNADRSSIATNNYRGSTAVISSAMMTAITARPNLVEINKSEDPQATVASSVQAQKVQFVRAMPAKTRQTAHSITIGKGSATSLQSQFIPEEILEESDNEEAFSTPTEPNSQIVNEARSVSAQPKIINLTKSSAVSRSQIDLTTTGIDNRMSSASVGSFKSALSGLDKARLAVPNQSSPHIQVIVDSGSENPFGATDGSVPVAGDKKSNVVVPSNGNYFSGTLEDLDGRISPFDDHYKL